MKRSLARVPALCSPLVFVSLFAVLSACAGTRAAYQAAETLDETAYVVAEHYAALLTEANDLADAGAPRAFVDRAQAIERDATPAVAALRRASAAYTAVASAENEEALQAALGEAVPLVSELLTLIRERR
jgi:hypothetical protein